MSPKVEEVLASQDQFNRLALAALVERISKDPRKSIRVLGALGSSSGLTWEQVRRQDAAIAGLARRWSATAFDPEGLVGEVWLRLVRPKLRHVLEDTSQLIRTGAGVAKLVQREHYRKWKEWIRETPLDTLSDPPASRASVYDEIAGSGVLEALREGLSADDQVLLEMLLEDRSSGNIAQALGIARGTVDVQKHRMIRKMRDKWVKLMGRKP